MSPCYSQIPSQLETIFRKLEKIKKSPQKTALARPRGAAFYSPEKYIQQSGFYEHISYFYFDTYQKTRSDWSLSIENYNT